MKEDTLRGLNKEKEKEEEESHSPGRGLRKSCNFLSVWLISLIPCLVYSLFSSVHVGRWGFVTHLSLDFPHYTIFLHHSRLVLSHVSCFSAQVSRLCLAAVLAKAEAQRCLNLYISPAANWWLQAIFSELLRGSVKQR